MGLLVFTSGDFSFVMVPNTDLIKQGTFHWTSDAAFTTIKINMTEAPCLVLPNVGKLFEVECDASNVRVVLSHDK